MLRGKRTGKEVTTMRETTRIEEAGTACDEAIARAGKVYNEATMPARKAYNEAAARAQEAYDEAQKERT